MKQFGSSKPQTKLSEHVSESEWNTSQIDSGAAVNVIPQLDMSIYNKCNHPHTTVHMCDGRKAPSSSKTELEVITRNGQQNFLEFAVVKDDLTLIDRTAEKWV